MLPREQNRIIKKITKSTDKKYLSPSQINSQNITSRDFSNKRYQLFREALYKNVNLSYDRHNHPTSVSPVYPLNPNRKLFKNSSKVNISASRHSPSPVLNYPNRSLIHDIRKPYSYIKKGKKNLKTSQSSLLKPADNTAFVTLDSRSITPQVPDKKSFRDTRCSAENDDVAPLAKREDSRMSPVSTYKPYMRYGRRRNSFYDDSYEHSTTSDNERSSHQSHSSIYVLLPRLSPTVDSKMPTSIRLLIDRLKDKEAQIKTKRILLTKIK
jgi:hypothetical protein